MELVEYAISAVQIGLTVRPMPFLDMLSNFKLGLEMKNFPYLCESYDICYDVCAVYE